MRPALRIDRRSRVYRPSLTKALWVGQHRLGVRGLRVLVTAQEAAEESPPDDTRLSLPLVPAKECIRGRSRKSSACFRKSKPRLDQNCGGPPPFGKFQPCRAALTCGNAHGDPLIFRCEEDYQEWLCEGLR